MTVNKDHLNLSKHTSQLCRRYGHLSSKRWKVRGFFDKGIVFLATWRSLFISAFPILPLTLQVLLSVLHTYEMQRLQSPTLRWNTCLKNILFFLLNYLIVNTSGSMLRSRPKMLASPFLATKLSGSFDLTVTVFANFFANSWILGIRIGCRLCLAFFRKWSFIHPQTTALQWKVDDRTVALSLN